MQFVKRRRVAGGFALFLIPTLLSACTADRNEEVVPDDPAASKSLSVESGQVSLVVQLTGLLLLVPPKESGGPTQVIMPKMPGHDAFIGFKGPKKDHCWRYDAARGICYANMDNWVLEPVGIKTSTEGSSTNSARNLLNLTHGSGGKKINVNGAKGRMRSQLTLGAGAEMEPCPLAEWTYDPVGDGDDAKPRQVQLVNVMKWEIDDIGVNSIVLARHKPNGSDRREMATLTPDGNGKIEILVMHIPRKERREFFKLTGVSDTDASPAPASIPAPQEEKSDPVAEVNDHFHAYYDLIGGVHQNDRPMPTGLKPLRDVCPISILGLRNAFPLPADSSALEPKDGPDFVWGTKTFSCVMTYAEQS